MNSKPVVFISSTSDLRSARELVGKVLYSMGYEPVWQDIEATDGGELLDVLRRRLDPCAMVVQLVGQRYGAEPPTPTPEFGRVSYTQFEALCAEKFGKKVIYHFIDPAFPTDPSKEESDERRDLQAAYRQRIKDANKLRQTVLSNQDLELSIRRISDELAEVRKQSQRRAKRLMIVGVASLLGIVLIASLVFVVMRRQQTVSVKFDQMVSRLDESEELIKQFLAERPLDARGQPIIPQLKGDLLQRAGELIAKGNKRQRLVAAVAMNDFSTADRLQAELRAEIKSEREAEDFDLAMLEGDRWYRAGDFDKAIEPYEQALALRPSNLTARDDTTLAHTQARLGDIAKHQRRAIEIAEGTMKIVAPGSTNWAVTQNTLGTAWYGMPTGDRGENLRNAIAAYEAARTVFAKDTDRSRWAATEHNLGVVWIDMPNGDKGENLGKAIAAFQAALTVRAKDVDPSGWAATQVSLGNAWHDMPTGNRGENFAKAIEAYQSTLTVYTKDAHPSDWAMTQNNLGAAWRTMPTGDKGKNVARAIAAFQAALTVRTKDVDPPGWAATQVNLGNAWCDMPNGDKDENLRNAIAAYQAALTVRTESADPSGWAATQNNLGSAWCEMTSGDIAENLGNAIAAYEAALTVRTKDADPSEWAATQDNLGSAWAQMPRGDRGENLNKAIAAYQAALTVRTKDRDPSSWATTQDNLGLAWTLAPAGNKSDNLGKAIVAFQSALTVFTKDAYPHDWTNTLVNLSWCQLLAKDFDQALATAGMARESNPSDLYLETNYAHALLLLNRTDEAEAIYLKHVGEKIGGRLWEDAIADDFDELEKQGISSPYFDVVRKLLKSAR